MKKIVMLLLVMGVASSISAQEELQINYINERIPKHLEMKMIIGSNFIISFYERINFPIEISSIDLRIFTLFKDYKSHQNLSSNTKSDNGYFSSSKHEIILFDNEKILKTFHHEFNHYLLRAYFKSPPKWINEGLSEYFENLSISESIVIKPNKKKIARIKSLLDDEIEDEIKQVLSISNTQWTEQNIKPEYRSSTISYAIVFFLLSLEDGEQILGEIIQKLMCGERSQDVLNSSYHGGYAKFIKDFIKFYKQQSC